MAYANKIEDHQKRRDQEGSYSVYNYIYRYLMDNYEPSQLDSMPSMALESLERKLMDVGKEYQVKGKGKFDEDTLRQCASDAITNFINNNGEHGDTAHNLGKMQDNSFETVKQSISDLRW